MKVTHLFTTNTLVHAQNIALYTFSKNTNAQIKTVDIIVGDISQMIQQA